MVHRRFAGFGLLLVLILAVLPVAAQQTSTTTPQQTSGSPTLAIVQSNNQHFQATVQFPTAQIGRTQDPSGTLYSEINMPGINDPMVGTGDEVGKPAVPVMTYMLAVPQDSITPTIQITVTPSQQISTTLAPIQPSPVDQDPEEEVIDYGDPPFTIDRAAYNLNQNFPANPVNVFHLGTMRDLSIVLVSVATGQYNPATHQLKLFSSVQFDVQFQGGTGFFLPARAFDAFERHTLPMYDRVVNHQAVVDHVNPNLDVTSCVGYEYLIITDPMFRAAADSLASWKWKKGISTRVVETGSGTGKAGTTKEAIRNFIGDEYKRCQVRPSYVLLFGDAEHIAPWYVKDGLNDDGVQQYLATDLFYSVIPSNVIDDTSIVPLPDLALGRIPVDTAADAQVVVDKIIGYEKTPPTNANFYKRVSLASYFQCCRISQADGTDSRAFVQTSEQVRNYLMGQNYTVQRIYTTNTNYYDDPTEDNYYDPSRDATPRYYFNGTPLPADLGPGSNAWNGTTTDVVDAFNQGRFLIMHRDHGSSSGWVDPKFTTSNIDSLTNGNLLPVVFSVNCSSGFFDNETDTNLTNDSKVYWAEKLLRKSNGGAVGILGDTRVSPTWENNAIARGFFDAVYPGFLPTYGTNTPHRRLGDILNYGKFYLLDQLYVSPQQVAGTLSTNNVRRDIYLYHVYGDPTMEMWTSDPTVRLPLSSSFTPVRQTAQGWTIDYAVEGATITLLQNGRPLGRAQVVGGQATIPFVTNVDPQAPIEASASVLDQIATPISAARPVYMSTLVR